MGRTAAVLIAALCLTACPQPVEMVEIATAPPAEAPVVEVWQPARLTVYVVDATRELCAEAVIRAYECRPDSYHQTLQAARLSVDMHNRDNPEQPRRAIGGGL